MAAAWEVLRDHYKGQMVCGELIIRRNKVNYSIGRLKHGVFNWTPLGLQMKEEFIPPRAVKPTPPPSPPARRPGRPRKVAVAPPEVTDAKADDQKL